MSLLLKNPGWWDGRTTRRGDLRLARGRIAAIGRGLRPRRGERVLELSGFLLLPGLINGHDHLGLNLLPHLGEPPYPSIYHFGEEVFDPEASPIQDHLRVPVGDRLRWGGYKNLVSGVTTAVHHDPYTRRVFERRFPVRVLRRYGWAHSLGWGPGSSAAFAEGTTSGEHVVRAFRESGGAPFILHAAEGIDDASYREIDRLNELGVLAKNTVLVHAIAVTPEQQRTLERTGTRVVWCPASNLRLYGQTAPVEHLKNRIDVVLGTDSTLTGSPTLLDEMRAAAASGRATPEEILEMVTSAPARVFGCEDRGRLREGAVADLWVLRDRGGTSAQQAVAATCESLELVILAGRVRLARPAWAEALGLGVANVRVVGQARWLWGDFSRLRQRIAAATAPWVPGDNPLWSLLQPLR